MEINMQIDLSQIKPGRFALSTAEAQMDKYETQMEINPFGKNNLIYLDIAEINLISAQDQRLDVSSQKERLSQLKEAHRKKYLNTLI